LNNESLGIIRKTEQGIEVEPLNEEGAALIQDVKAQEGKKKVSFKSEAPQECPAEPKVPRALTLCAAVEDLKAAREGGISHLTLLERLMKREVLRERWEREGDTAELYEEIEKLEE
jgi:hypothetical protein